MMKLALLALLSAGITLPGSVVGFDDLATPRSFRSEVNAWGAVPASYAGLNWAGWEVMNQNAFNALYEDPTAIPSGPNFAYSSTGSDPLWVNSSSPFLFLGAQLAGWPYTMDPVARSVTIYGYLDGRAVGSVTQELSDTEWSTTGGIAGFVDTLEFVPADRYFRMDNVEISPAPEPATMVLFGAGLAGLGIVRRAARVRAGASRFDG